MGASESKDLSRIENCASLFEEPYQSHFVDFILRGFGEKDLRSLVRVEPSFEKLSSYLGNEFDLQRELIAFVTEILKHGGAKIAEREHCKFIVGVSMALSSLVTDDDELVRENVNFIKNGKDVCRMICEFVMRHLNITCNNVGFESMKLKDDVSPILRLSAYCENDKNRGILRLLIRTFWNRILLQKDFHLPSLASVKAISSILSAEDVFVLSNRLPEDCRSTWKILYSTEINGRSWFQLSSSILYRGSTILLIKDKEGNVFGSFTYTSWKPDPDFYGDSSCFVFSLKPKIAIYEHSGYNKNFQYLNQGMQFLPNGIGFGGQLNFFGLWIDANAFGTGYAKPNCSTFCNEPLTSKESFEFEKLEVWCVRQEEIDDRLVDKKSAMVANPEVMNLLEMANRPTYHHYEDESPE